MPELKPVVPESWVEPLNPLATLLHLQQLAWCQR